MVGVALHDVPEQRPAADLDHRLGTKLGLFAHTGALAPAQQDDFHAHAAVIGTIAYHLRVTLKTLQSAADYAARWNPSSASAS